MITSVAHTTSLACAIPDGENGDTLIVMDQFASESWTWMDGIWSDNEGIQFSPANYRDDLVSWSIARTER